MQTGAAVATPGAAWQSWHVWLIRVQASCRRRPMIDTRIVCGFQQRHRVCLSVCVSVRASAAAVITYIARDRVPGIHGP